MTAVAWLLANWRAVALAAVLGLFALLWASWSARGQALADERDRSDALQAELTTARETIERERAATAAAQKAAADWTAEAADRARDLQDAIEQGKRANEAFNTCMGQRWPDAVIDRLPD